MDDPTTLELPWASPLSENTERLIEYCKSRTGCNFLYALEVVAGAGYRVRH